MNITDLQQIIGEINGKSGFNQAEDVPEEFRDLYWDRKILLVVSELVEAQDELRNGRHISEEYTSTPAEGALAKPEGAPSELADAIIRLLGIAYEAGIDMQAVIEGKLAYNRTRGFRHGKQF
jgi:NTP pyrophosphatase (non-canonical NTP hydrolase)